ncbi:hypothetical protein MKW98_016725, partial [Papaver atlanticum]
FLNLLLQTYLSSPSVSSSSISNSEDNRWNWSFMVVRQWLRQRVQLEGILLFVKVMQIKSHVR